MVYNVYVIILDIWLQWEVRCVCFTNLDDEFMDRTT